MIRLGFGATKTWVGILGFVSFNMLHDLSEPTFHYVKMIVTPVLQRDYKG